MSEFKTQKEYLRYRGGIYKEKDDEVFKSKIRQLYKNKSIRTNWLKKELGILQKDNSNFITYIGLIVSSLVAAFATSIITKPEIFKQIKELGILAIIKTTGIILPFLIIFGIIIRMLTN